MTERNGRGKRDGVAAEQRELHAALTLCHPVAHRRHAACDLGRRPDFSCEQLHLFGVPAVGLMRRKHVVVGGDDADIHGSAVADRTLIPACGCKAVCKISAGKHRAIYA